MLHGLLLRAAVVDAARRVAAALPGTGLLRAGRPIRNLAAIAGPLPVEAPGGARLRQAVPDQLTRALTSIRVRKRRKV